MAAMKIIGTRECGLDVVLVSPDEQSAKGRAQRDRVSWFTGLKALKSVAIFDTPGLVVGCNFGWNENIQGLVAVQVYPEQVDTALILEEIVLLGGASRLKLQTALHTFASEQTVSAGRSHVMTPVLSPEHEMFLLSQGYTPVEGGAVKQVA